NLYCGAYSKIDFPETNNVVELLLQTALLVFFILAIFFFIKGRKQVNRPFIITDAKKRNSFSKGIFLALINLWQFLIIVG
ncbi:hypothetical protein Q2T40_03490, partial [Winogradskyella maritima]|nr:hypothetical protein [Winogradskyella maritima]